MVVEVQAEFLRALAQKMSVRQNVRSAARFTARAVEAEESAAVLRSILPSSSVPDLSEDGLHDGEPADEHAEAEASP
jgi:uncharacterized protein (UPF0147 family)